MKRVIIDSAMQAGALLRRRFRKAGNHIKYKKNKEIVGAADLAANRLITRLLKKAYPNIPILSEESPPVDMSAKKLFIIDPLDGTTNFTRGNSLFSVNIAYVERGRLLMGAIYSPIADELYFAEKGKGAWRNKKRIHVSGEGSLSDAYAILCHGYATKDISRGGHVYKTVHPKIRYCRMFGCAGIETASVASGEADAFLYTAPKVWDIAPGALIVREAGGKVTNEHGEFWKFNHEPKLAIFSNGKMHSSLVKLVQKALRSE